MANAIPRVPELLLERLASAPGKVAPWAEVMQLALYEPLVGYYRQGVRRIGRGGDFYTSVSVGPLYGELLAEHATGVWTAAGCPERFAVLEQGAHDGTLARDLVEAVHRHHPELAVSLRYVIIEPDETLREAQQARLGPEFAAHLSHAATWAEVPEVQGLLICNELLDAFAVHRIEFTSEGWKELHVTTRGDGAFEFVQGPPSTPGLQVELERLGNDFPIGFVTELNVAMLGWLAEVSQSAFTGEILLADYGHAAREYYIPERNGGTLRRYCQHRTDDRVLENLGEADLTAHVNFTRLAEQAVALGMTVMEFIEQGRFLTHVAAHLLRRPGFSPDPAWLRQFQTLTHPGHLGHAFHILALQKGGWESKAEPDAGRRAAALRRLGMESAPIH
ncbi:class I SAM-dependent methyltransferase [Verrucomicrobium spinosum]|uniref:class I SAM-dependent methyltransferase n=2 Tax=Verrucomicrobium spinosum TaxID=2736 RepID=UPI00017445E4|nr:SAM-dependent methyltransferase [Verrucomicrobium spinosum]